MNFFSLGKRRLEKLVIRVYKIMKMINGVSAESVIHQILQYQRCEAPSETSIPFKQIKESSLHSRYFDSGACCHKRLWKQYQESQRGLDKFEDSKSIHGLYREQASLHPLIFLIQQFWTLGKGPQVLPQAHVLISLCPSLSCTTGLSGPWVLPKSESHVFLYLKVIQTERNLQSCRLLRPFPYV